MMIKQTKRNKTNKIVFNDFTFGGNEEIIDLYNLGFSFYEIKTNNDWAKLKTLHNLQKKIININNQYYFGLRAIQNHCTIIYFNVEKIDNLERMVKECIKEGTPSFIVFNLDDINPSLITEEINISFLEYISTKLNYILDLGYQDFIITLVNDKKVNLEKIVWTLSHLYKQPLALINPNPKDHSCFKANNLLNYVLYTNAK